jgi:hypothetical protein
MKKTLFLFLLAMLFACRAWSQDNKVVELDAVEIIPTDQILVYSNFSKRHQDLRAKFSGVGVSEIATVTGFVNPKESVIELEGLEFFFNYQWDQDSSGFYVQPVVVKEDGLPNVDHTDFSEKYLVTSKLKNRLYIDLSTKGISLSSGERVYVGIKFLENLNPETQNTFNITFISGRIEEHTYLLYPDGRRPEEVLSPGKHSAGLKYSVVYKLKE